MEKIDTKRHKNTKISFLPLSLAQQNKQDRDPTQMNERVHYGAQFSQTENLSLEKHKKLKG
eukprot:scaffold21448_cov73-Cyclotella_meneghiniana.AAC.5